jgi:choline monooxygenase
MTYAVDPDITRAATLDKTFYADEQAFAITRERVFARTWQWVGDLDDVAVPGSLSPRDLLPGLLDEPLLLARDEAGTLRCLSNVCTHRGNLLVPHACRAAQIRCGYHSRRFDLAGRMTFMPEFAGAVDFPSAADDLPEVALAQWSGHGFVSLDPAATFESFIGDAVRDVVSPGVERFRRDRSRDREFVIAAHWALYVENYLEGFHIPFVHGELAEVVDYASYTTTLHRFSNVQIACARPGETAFEPSPDSADTYRVAARYGWIFPNLMLNFYPWGLSVNLVQPEAIDRTRVSFRSYVADESLIDSGAGGRLDRVEAQDEAIVEAVQRGVRSRLYRGGRYSPTRERGVHHFHRLLCEFMGAA